MRQRHIKYLSIFLIILICSPAANHSYAGILEKAKDFELNGLDEKNYKLSDLKGNVVLLNFWATWCKYCVKENPSLDRLFNEFSEDGLIVLGISVDRSDLTVKNFLKKNPVSYPILMDSKGDVFVKTYTVRGIPVTFLINKEGYIVDKLIGKQNFDSNKFKNKISALLRDEGE